MLKALVLFAEALTHAIRLVSRPKQGMSIVADLAFGPDYQHHQGTAFGFYVEGFGAVADGDAELQAEPGKTISSYNTADSSVYFTCMQQHAIRLSEHADWDQLKVLAFCQTCQEGHLCV